VIGIARPQEAMVLVERGHRNIYIPIIEPEANPAAFANDACFGRADPADDAGTYDELDAEHNALEQIPCLTRECVTPHHAARHARYASQPTARPVWRFVGVHSVAAVRLHHSTSILS